MCNLRCKHCYQENHVPVQLAYSDLIVILNQYRKLLKKLKVRGHINLTGGEPLSCPYFFELLKEFQKDKDLYSFSILTNGTLITRDIAKKISDFTPEYVQISLEGGKKVNDYIRGRGVYHRVGKSAQLLKQQGIFVSLSFTATKYNYREFPKVVRYAEKIGVDNIWSDRYIPFGNKYDEMFIMDLQCTREYLDILKEERLRLRQKNSKTHISMYRALQFQMTNDFPYHCSAGISLLTVMENGDLVPCRRMPIVLGNLLEHDMYDLYVKSPLIKKLQVSIPDKCAKCEHSERCRGGLKCLTYALFGALNEKDIGCSL